MITEEEKQAVFSKLNTEVIEKYGNHVMSSVAPLSFTTDLCIIQYFILDSQADQSHLEYVLDIKTGSVTPFHLFKSFNDDIMQVVAQPQGRLLIQEDWIPVQMNGQSGASYELYLPKFRLIEQADYLQSHLKGEEIQLLPLQEG